MRGCPPAPSPFKHSGSTYNIHVYVIFSLHFLHLCLYIWHVIELFSREDIPINICRQRSSSISCQALLYQIWRWHFNYLFHFCAAVLMRETLKLDTRVPSLHQTFSLDLNMKSRDRYIPFSKCVLLCFFTYMYVHLMHLAIVWKPDTAIIALSRYRVIDLCTTR